MSTNRTIYDDNRKKLLESVVVMRSPKKKFFLDRTYYNIFLPSTTISGRASNVVKVNGDNIITDTRYYNIIMTQVLLGKNRTIRMSSIQCYYRRTLTVTPYHAHFVLFYSVFVPLEGKQR